MGNSLYDNKIKVLHVVGRMDRGGTEALLMSLLHTIDRDRYQFDFVEQTEDECDYDQEILGLGSKIYRCPNISSESIKKYREWWKEFFTEHPEYAIIHGHSRGSAPIYLDEANKAGRTTIMHCHNNSHGKGVKGAIRYVWQLPLRKIGKYNFACSYDSGVSQFGKNGTFEVIKNGIISERFAWNPDIREKKRKELGIENSFVIGNVARFVEQKNHVFLIKVFNEVQKLNPDSKLMLVGEGPLEKDVRKQIKELGIEDKVIFTGVRSDVNELMQAMDAFLLPSYFEGLGIVNIEAQAAGLPCFVSDKVIPPEVDITELMHHIPLEESPKEWAVKILDGRIKTEDRKERCEDIVNAGYDIKATAERLCEFYAEVEND